jgi:hypothetical protein
MAREMPRTPFDDDAPPDFDALRTPADMRAFAPEQLVACPTCLRANAPTRQRCLYCGATLPATTDAANLRRPAQRKLEEWEQGFNVVLPARAETETELPREPLITAAQLLRLVPEQLEQIIAARTPLPLARTATVDEAALIKRRLAPLGLSVEIMADELLSAASPQRIRQLELADAGLTGWARADAECRCLAWTEIVLLVVGRISRRQIEIEEQHGRNAQSEVVETREFYDDESVLDVHGREADQHWRIRAGNFDYKCLGAQKSLLAAENFTHLVALMSQHARAASFDDGYARLRHLLQTAWPATEQTSAGGLRRERIGRLRTGAITSVSNETQFTRYSRLRRHFALLAQRDETATQGPTPPDAASR